MVQSENKNSFLHLDNKEDIDILLTEEIKSISTFGDVPKWLKGLVCKTNIHRFESGRCLHLNAG